MSTCTTSRRRWAVVTMSAVALASPVGASTAAATEIDTWEGRCTVAGELKFDRPFGGYPTFAEWREQAAGVCTGTLNGVAVSDAPVVHHGRGSGTLSCVVGGADMRMEGVLTFTNGTPSPADDVSLRDGGQSFSAMGQSVALMRGAAGGQAVAHVDFAGASGPDTFDKCANSAVTSMRFRSTSQTLTAMKG